MKKISWKTYMDLPKNYFADPASEFLPFGKWFIFNFLSRKEHDSELYNEPKMLEAGKIIEKKICRSAKRNKGQ